MTILDIPQGMKGLSDLSTKYKVMNDYKNLTLRIRVRVWTRAEKSTYLATVRLEPTWDLLNLRANFQRNQKFLCFLRAVTSLFHDIRTDNCMYNHIGYKESCKCTD